MKPALALFLFLTHTQAASVFLTWEPPDNVTNLVGYRVMVATNKAVWTDVFIIQTNAITLPDKMPGTWKVGVLALRQGVGFGANDVDWSLRFTIDPPKPVVPVVTNAVPATNGLALWLTAEGLNPLVSFWPDKSGHGHDALQSTASFQPKLQGKRVHFDGVDDFMTFNLPINGLTNMTLVLVSANSVPQTAGDTQAERAALFWNETFNWGCVYLSPWQTSVALRFGTKQVGSRILFKRNASIGNALTRTIAIHKGNMDSLWTNGTLNWEQSGKLPTIAACRDTGNLGRGFDDNTFFAGDIAELLVYTRALSDEERMALDKYLETKY